ncbi:unnamed protein product [Durusdinium trenchii]|uniref:Uncharacterized protein n=1 Tax=Durusdinium trenchii TaxID=1381693 RepID=A0ABP0MY80_9DINO
MVAAHPASRTWAHGWLWPKPSQCRARMGCASSRVTGVLPSQALEPCWIQKEIEVSDIHLQEMAGEVNKCIVQFGDRAEAECTEPIGQTDYDSWKHQMDSTDMKALKAGFPLPMNKLANDVKAKKMNTCLLKLVDDPSALQKAVKIRRMELEDVKAYHAVASLHSQPEADNFKRKEPSPALQNQKKHLAEIHNL